MLQGVEPSLRWRRFTDNVIAHRARARRAHGDHARRAARGRAAHAARSRSPGIGSDDSLVERLGFEPPSYEGPTGIVGVLHSTPAPSAGLASASLWASVPHYVAAAPNPKVALALVRAFEGVAGVAVDAGELESAAEDYERQVSAAVASDPEVKAFVERLETAMDEVRPRTRRTSRPAVRGHDRARLPALPAPARARELAVARSRPPATGRSARLREQEQPDHQARRRRSPSGSGRPFGCRVRPPSRPRRI